MRTLLFAFLLLGCNIALAQTNQARPINNLSFKHIFIKNSSNKLYNFDPPKSLAKAFGKPQKIVKQEDEMLGGYDYFYQYKGFEVVFNEQNWESTTITGSNYTFLINGIAYKVGDNISKFKKYFPRCFIKKQRGISHSAVQIWIGKSDTFIYVDSNDKDIITNILIANS